MSWNFFDSWKSMRTSEEPLECSEEEFQGQERTCLDRYKKWKDCVDESGFNDPYCRGELMGKYYKCVIKQNRMKIYLEDRDLRESKK